MTSKITEMEAGGVTLGRGQLDDGGEYIHLDHHVIQLRDRSDVLALADALCQLADDIWPEPEQPSFQAFKPHEISRREG